MAEDEHVGAGEVAGAALLSAGCRAGLVHDGEPESAQVGPGDLGQPFSQLGSVVVAVDADQAFRAGFEQVECSEVDPVTGMVRLLASA